MTGQSTNKAGHAEEDLNLPSENAHLSPPVFLVFPLAKSVLFRGNPEQRSTTGLNYHFFFFLGMELEIFFTAVFNRFMV